MRKILFKGKRVSDGKWVKGDLRQWNDDTTYIFDDNYSFSESRVLPETVCQYTGLTDFDGNPIFEGDLFEPDDTEIHKCVVEFREGAFRVVSYGTVGALMEYGWDETAGGYGEIDEHDLLDWVTAAVIGNIHDNPELLDGGSHG